MWSLGCAINTSSTSFSNPPYVLHFYLMKMSDKKGLIKMRNLSCTTWAFNCLKFWLFVKRFKHKSYRLYLNWGQLLGHSVHFVMRNLNAKFCDFKLENHADFNF